MMWDLGVGSGGVTNMSSSFWFCLAFECHYSGSVQSSSLWILHQFLEKKKIKVQLIDLLYNLITNTSFLSHLGPILLTPNIYIFS